MARQQLLMAHPEVLDVLVHVDAEDDLIPPPRPGGLPDRERLLAHLWDLLGEDGAPAFEQATLHYLGNKVEAELVLPPQMLADTRRIAAMEQRIVRMLPQDPWFSAVTLHCRIAPK